MNIYSLLAIASLVVDSLNTEFLFKALNRSISDASISSPSQDTVPLSAPCNNESLFGLLKL